MARAPRTKEQEILAVVVLIILFVLISSFFIIYCIIYVLDRKRSFRFEAMRSQPTNSVREQIEPTRSVQFDQGIRFLCREYPKQYIAREYSQGEKPQEAIDWIERFLNGRAHGNRRPAIRVPKSAYIISVPLKNFKCGNTSTDFLPVDCTTGNIPRGNYTYQMCGDGRFQIVRYTEDGVTYFAGYCVYITQPYASSACYQAFHIENCYSGPEYVPKTVGEPQETSALLTSNGNFEVVIEDELAMTSNEESSDCETLKDFKLHFCKVKQQIVALGVADGVMKHFVWDKTTKSYEPSDCASCRNVKFEDDPPSYQSLDF